MADNVSLPVRVVLQEGQFAYWKMRRLKDGAEITLQHKGQFSHRWMKAIGWEPPPPRPPRQTSRQQLTAALAENKLLASELDGLKKEMAELKALITGGNSKPAAPAVKEGPAKAKGRAKAEA